MEWCITNNLVLNVDKTKGIIVDSRRNRHSHTPLFVNSTAWELVNSPKFLAVQITDSLTWSQKRRAHHREHTDQLHLCLVWRLQNLRLEVYAESGEDGGEDYCDIANNIFKDPTYLHYDLASLWASGKRFPGI